MSPDAAAPDGEAIASTPGGEGVGARRSKLIVAAIVLLAVVLAIAARVYVSSGSGPEALARLECDSLRPTVGEMQGARIELDRSQVCAALAELARQSPTADRFADDTADPWHYLARVRVQPPNDAYFLVFVARRSTGFRPELSLRHRRGAGWAVIGHYDGVPTLERFGLLDRIDSARLAAPASRTVRDQREAL